VRHPQLPAHLPVPETGCVEDYGSPRLRPDRLPAILDALTAGYSVRGLPADVPAVLARKSPIWSGYDDLLHGPPHKPAQSLRPDHYGRVRWHSVLHQSPSEYADL